MNQQKKRKILNHILFLAAAAASAFGLYYMAEASETKTEQEKAPALSQTREEITEDKLLSMLPADQEDGVYRSYYADFDGDGIKELFAFLGSNVKEAPSWKAELWYADQAGAQKVTEFKEFWMEPELFVFDRGALLKIEEFSGGSASCSRVFKVSEGRVGQVQNTAAGLEHLNGRDFAIYPGAFDHYADGSGHTWKRYYLYWNGKEFREYGAIKITPKDLLTLAGAEDIIKLIEDSGYQLQEIWYRENGTIQINYDDGTNYENAALLYHNNRVELAKITDLPASETLPKELACSSFGGIYEQAYYPEIADYPEVFLGKPDE